jgi:hypothetical protein
VDDALEADRLMEMVEGAVPEVELVEEDPPEVMDFQPGQLGHGHLPQRQLARRHRLPDQPRHLVDER